MTARYGQRPIATERDDIVHPERPAWQLQAACRGDHHWFHLDPQHSHKQAAQIKERQAICAACPVTAQCAQQALDEFGAIGSQVRAGVFVAGLSSGGRGQRELRRTARGKLEAVVYRRCVAAPTYGDVISPPTSRGAPRDGSITRRPREPDKGISGPRSANEELTRDPR